MQRVPCLEPLNHRFPPVIVWAKPQANSVSRHHEPVRSGIGFDAAAGRHHVNEVAPSGGRVNLPPSSSTGEESPIAKSNATLFGTPVIVEHLVDRIDEVVKAFWFEGWQATIRGDQEVRQALRKTLYVQLTIRDNDVYEKAVGYVWESTNDFELPTGGPPPLRCPRHIRTFVAIKD